MKPVEIIEMLSKANGSVKGHLWFTQPMTNIPLGEEDSQAGKILKFMGEIMPPRSTLQEHLNALLDAIWWLIFFSALQNDEAFKEQPK